MNFEPGPDGVVRISFEIADLKTWVQIPVGALDFRLVLDFFREFIKPRTPSPAGSSHPWRNPERS